MKAKLKKRVLKVARPAILKSNYFLKHYKEVVWLIGDGRSGTTWVSDLITHQKKYREMFEPFHPQKVEEMSFLGLHQYVRPGECNEELSEACSKVFSGKLIHKRVDSGNRSLFYQGLLVKDIFANLFAYWAVNQFPHVKPVLLLRNPFAVALSKQKKKNWFWLTDPQVFLTQQALLEDFISPFEDLIKEVSLENNYILNQVLIWSIINYVPMKQFSADALHVCAYENLYENPQLELSKILGFIEGVSAVDVILPDRLIHKPSRVSGKESTVRSGVSPVFSWKNEIDSQTIDRGYGILEKFGLESLFNNEGLLNRDVLPDSGV